MVETQKKIIYYLFWKWKTISMCPNTELGSRHLGPDDKLPNGEWSPISKEDDNNGKSSKPNAEIREEAKSII